MTPEQVARFWAKVDKSGACWIWTGGRVGGGYGSFWDGSHTVLAHRLAWELAHGPIPPGKHVCHDCPGGDNPLCVRHLWLGTNADNMADKVAKGRQARGQHNGAAKLTDADVYVIKQRLAAGEIGAQLAREYGVVKNTIYHIRNNRTHAWINI